ncbi:MAG: hypothetical protein KBG19_07810 [Bacteroidales bacterium]|nr:hypothetical protein [Bacteroidales bacterium]
MNCEVKTYDALQAQKEGKPLTTADKIILLRSKYTHSEFQFSERYDNVSFSFSLADGSDGARFKNIKYEHMERWKTQIIPISDNIEDGLWRVACTLAYLPLDWILDTTGKYATITDGEIVYKGKLNWKYDLIGLLTHALKKSPDWKTNLIRSGLWFWTTFIKADPNKAWCSEGVAMLIKWAFYDFCKNPEKLDPEELYDKISKYFASNTDNIV